MHDDRRPHLTADQVRAIRRALALSASEAARLIGVYDGANWRRLERNGVSGAGAILLSAIMESAAVRAHFGLPADISDAHSAGKFTPR